MGDLPSWMSDKAKRQTQNKRSARQEKARADEIGGRPTPGSGSSYRAPQDVSTNTSGDEDDYLEQLKYTDAKSFTIKESEWLSLERDAHRQGKEPRWVVEAFGRRFVITEG